MRNLGSRKSQWIKKDLEVIEHSSGYAFHFLVGQSGTALFNPQAFRSVMRELVKP